MNLITRIYDEMSSDYDDLDKQSEYLARLYEQADAAGRQLLDDALVCLCGYSLSTLLAQAG